MEGNTRLRMTKKANNTTQKGFRTSIINVKMKTHYYTYKEI
jgi:hypothetical protein